MSGKRILRVLKVVAIVIVVTGVFGFAVTSLWNELMPGLFGLRAITFWQAVGLMILGRLLFGGFRPGGVAHRWRGQMMRRWEQMTPEEREKFREGMRGRCGQPRTPAPEPSRGPAA
jgi:hypothetical protein